MEHSLNLDGTSPIRTQLWEVEQMRDAHGWHGTLYAIPQHTGQWLVTENEPPRHVYSYYVLEGRLPAVAITYWHRSDYTPPPLPVTRPKYCLCGRARVQFCMYCGGPLCQPCADAGACLKCYEDSQK